MVVSVVSAARAATVALVVPVVWVVRRLMVVWRAPRVLRVRISLVLGAVLAALVVTALMPRC
jgi:hypothetical protein